MENEGKHFIEETNAEGGKGQALLGKKACEKGFAIASFTCLQLHIVFLGINLLG